MLLEQDVTEKKQFQNKHKTVLKWFKILTWDHYPLRVEMDKCSGIFPICQKYQSTYPTPVERFLVKEK